MNEITIPTKPLYLKSFKVDDHITHLWRMIDALRRNVDSLAGRSVGGTNVIHQTITEDHVVPGSDVTAFHTGGDSFGADAVLGTNDAYDVYIERGGTSVADFNATRIKLASAYSLYLGATASFVTPGKDIIAAQDTDTSALRCSIQNLSTGTAAHTVFTAVNNAADSRYVSFGVTSSNWSVVGDYRAAGEGFLEMASAGLGGTARPLSVWNRLNSYLRLGTADTERLRILAAGQVCINATALVGSEQLRVNGSGYFDSSLTVIGSAVTATSATGAFSRVIGGSTSRTISGGSGQVYLAQTSQCQLFFDVTDQGTNAKLWDINPTGTTMQFRLINDANSAAFSYLSVTRTAGASGHSPTAVVINEDGASCDFRVESDTFTNAISMSGATGIVTFGAGISLSTMTAGSVIFAGSSGAFSQSNANFFWDNTNVVLALGGNETSLVVSGTTYYPTLYIHNDTAGQTVLGSFHKHSGTAASGSNLEFGRSRGSEASETVVSDNDIVSRISFTGYDGTDYERCAEIVIAIDDATPSGTSMGGEILFKTSASGSVTPTTRLTIASTGHLSATVSDTSTTPVCDFIQSSTGDAAIRFAIGTTKSYAFGPDNSATNDPIKISYAASGSAVLGTGDIHQFTDRFSGDLLPNDGHATTVGTGWHRIYGNAANEYLDIGWYRYGSMISFAGARGSGSNAMLEFFGNANGLGYGAVCTMDTDSSSYRAFHLRNPADTDGLMLYWNASGPMLTTEASTSFDLGPAQTRYVRMTTTQLKLESTFQLGWCSGAVTTSTNINLVPIGAGVLSLQNDTSGCEWRVYGTTTGAKYFKIVADTGGEVILDSSVASTRIFVGGQSTKMNPNGDRGCQLGDASYRWESLDAFTYLAVGSAPASAGHIRLNSEGVIRYRNAANSDNLNLISSNSSDAIVLGDTGTATLMSRAGNGQNVSIAEVTELTTIAAAATTDTAIQIPANAVVFAVSVRVTVVIPTAATFTVTGTTSGTQFDVAGGVAVAANTTDVGTRNCPYKNGAAQTIRITPDIAPAANTGRVRVTIHYYTVTVPTS